MTIPRQLTLLLSVTVGSNF